MSGTFSDDESMSADQLTVAIGKIREQQNLRFPRSSYWQALGLFADPVDVSTDEDPSGLEGFITTPALFVDSPPAGNLAETDMQALRKDWVAVGNDLRIAILRHRLENAL